MTRFFAGAVLGLLVLAGRLPAQQGIQRGTIKTVDAEKGTVTITVEGKDHTCTVTESTRVWDRDMQIIKEGLKDKRFRPGAGVQFREDMKDGKKVLFGIKLAGSGGAANPQFRPRAARIKKVDAEKNILTLTVDGKDQDFEVTEKTRMMGARGEIKDGLKDKQFKAGSPVMFVARKQGDRLVLVGVRLGGGVSGQPPEKIDTSKLKPLTELGKGRYKDYEGGLYPDGKNERPPAHETAGLALARAVKSLDADGRPSADGKIVLLSVGMSNTTQEFSTFKRFAQDDAAKNPRLVIVDGAQGGMTAAVVQDAERGRGRQYWEVVDRRLQDAGVTRAQVQVTWIKEADAGPNQGFPGYAKTLQEELGTIVRLMKERFPNLKMVYLSSRICAAFAKTRLNPEPYAYESGFSVKWLIEQQLKGDKALNFDPKKGKVRAPWLSWGPYLWTNGVTKRADGLTYEESDFAGDGTHPSRSGQEKVARQLLQFFKTDSTARPWFLGKAASDAKK